LIGVNCGNIVNLTATIDWESRVAETNENNNTLTKSIGTTPYSGQLTDTNCYTCPVNGQCGSSNGGTFSTAPTTNLCNVGNFSGMTGSGPWLWYCYGTNGGTNATCSANKLHPLRLMDLAII
jgi:hypothetical protein